MLTHQHIKELEAQLAVAQKQLKEAELKAKLLDTVIDVAEWQMGCQIRKKRVAKPSSSLRCDGIPPKVLCWLSG